MCNESDVTMQLYQTLRSGLRWVEPNDLSCQQRYSRAAAFNDSHDTSTWLAKVQRT